MATEMGEYLVGAYLRMVMVCELVDYNVKIPLVGYEHFDLDVLGLSFITNSAYVCEVSTHIDGILYGNGNQDTIKIIKKKHHAQLEYAKMILPYFRDFHFMFWAPRVPEGFLTEQLSEIGTLELVINQDYTKAIEKLHDLAKKNKEKTGNPAFRMIQILENLRK